MTESGITIDISFLALGFYTACRPLRPEFVKYPILKAQGQRGEDERELIGIQRGVMTQILQELMDLAFSKLIRSTRKGKENGTMSEGVEIEMNFIFGGQ